MHPPSPRTAFIPVHRTGYSAEGFIKHYETKRRRKDGQIIDVSLTVSPIKDTSGKIIGASIIARNITESKRAEEALRASEERFSKVFQASPAPTYISTISDGRYKDVNNSGLQLLGYSREEMIGHTVQELGIWYNFPERKSILQKLITRDSIHHEPVLLRTKNGEVKKTLLSCEIIRLDDEEVMLSLVHDITELRQAEETLRQSEEKYRTILESIQEGYFEVDFTGNLTFFNDSLCRFLGYSKEELMGMNNRQYTDKENAKKLYQVFTEVYKTGKPTEGFDWQIIRKDGTKRYVEASVSLQKDLTDKPKGFRGIVRDVTERKKAEADLRESEEKYRTILEDMDDVYFEVDIKGNITFVNRSSCKMSGYSKEELLGMSFKKISITDSIEKVREYFGEIFLTGKTGKPFLWNLEKKNGEQGFFEIVTSLIRDKQDKPIGFRGIGRDITDRKRAEEKLQQTLGSLKNAVGVTIQTLVSAVEMRDPYTAGHQTKVADLARAIATEMELPRDKIDGIRMAGSIHDIGKLSIPAEILSKPTKLTNTEFSLIKEHPQSGYEMLKNVESPWPLAQIVYQHHERMDGSGYPRKLKGDEILLEARILAVADVVEAMGSHRPYRPALGIKVALEEIEKNKGIFYEDAVVDACLKLFREKGYQLT